MIISSNISPSIPRLELSEAGTMRLLDFAFDKADEYGNNLPFPHVVIDDLFPDEILDGVVQDIRLHQREAAKNSRTTVAKFATNDPWALGPTARQFLLDLNSGAFCRFLEALTGIQGLIPDPYYFGGGVHEIRTGGFLKMHTDFNWHRGLKLDRRLNMLVYLNRDWQEEWGGHLELWNSDMSRRGVRVSPVFNRTVIFSTTDYSYHGHPDPLECPESTSRMSIALYYYTNGRPAGETKFEKSTRTNYEERPGETLGLKAGLKKRLMPILTGVSRRLRG